MGKCELSQGKLLTRWRITGFQKARMQAVIYSTQKNIIKKLKEEIKSLKITIEKNNEKKRDKYFFHLII